MDVRLSQIRIVKPFLCLTRVVKEKVIRGYLINFIYLQQCSNDNNNDSNNDNAPCSATDFVSFRTYEVMFSCIELRQNEFRRCPERRLRINVVMWLLLVVKINSSKIIKMHSKEKPHSPPGMPRAHIGSDPGDTTPVTSVVAHRE